MGIALTVIVAYLFAAAITVGMVGRAFHEDYDENRSDSYKSKYSFPAGEDIFLAFVAGAVWPATLLVIAVDLAAESAPARHAWRLFVIAFSGKPPYDPDSDERDDQ